MIYFNSLACQQAFKDAVAASPSLLKKCWSLIGHRDSPCALYLHLGREDDSGKYFDFGVFRLNVVVYKDSFGQERPELTDVPTLELKVENRLFNGGLVNRNGVWSSHT